MRTLIGICVSDVLAGQALYLDEAGKLTTEPMSEVEAWRAKYDAICRELDSVHRSTEDARAALQKQVSAGKAVIESQGRNMHALATKVGQLLVERDALRKQHEDAYVEIQCLRARYEAPPMQYGTSRGPRGIWW
jgi:hypothetical protein